MKQQEEPEGHCGGRRGAGARGLGQQLGVQKSDPFPVVIVEETGTAVEERKTFAIHLTPDNWTSWSVTEAAKVVFLVLCRKKAREHEIAGRKNAWVSMERARGFFNHAQKGAML